MSCFLILPLSCAVRISWDGQDAEGGAANGSHEEEDDDEDEEDEDEEESELHAGQTRPREETSEEQAAGEENRGKRCRMEGGDSVPGEAAQLEETATAKEGGPGGSSSASENRCDLLWQGILAKWTFHAFRFQVS